MKTKPTQDLSGMNTVFNLAGERGDDPFRVERERWEAVERERVGREFQVRMQRTLEVCPGLAGCEVPRSITSQGVVMIEPECVKAAMPWLKRRFHVNNQVAVETTGELRVEIQPRQPKKKVGGSSPVKVEFKRLEQFQLGLFTKAT